MIPRLDRRAGRGALPIEALRTRTETGLTLVELIITVAIVAILATAAVPVARFQVKRTKERELRNDLWEMRTAIDRYKDAADTKAYLGMVNRNVYEDVRGDEETTGKPAPAPATFWSERRERRANEWSRAPSWKKRRSRRNWPAIDRVARRRRRRISDESMLTGRTCTVIIVCSVLIGVILVATAIGVGIYFIEEGRSKIRREAKESEAKVTVPAIVLKPARPTPPTVSTNAELKNSSNRRSWTKRGNKNASSSTSRKSQ